LRKRLTIILVGVLAVLLVAAAVVVGVHWWRAAHRTRLEQATAYAPAEAARLSWTDWAAVRRHLGAHLDADSSQAEQARMLDRGYDEDLTSASALVQSAPVLQKSFGFSPASADWELFSQSTKGAVVIIKMPHGTDFDAISGRLEHDGFTKPSDDGGVWLGGEDLLPEIGNDLTPELQYVALEPDRGLVLTSDKAGYLSSYVDRLGHQHLPGSMRSVVSASGSPLSASIYDGDYTCSALAMSSADADDQATAARLVQEAGEVDPVTGFAMSVQPDRDVRVVLGFADGDQARRNADSRAKLATGPAPGQGGDFSDRFSLVSSTAHGDLVTLHLRPARGAYVLSDLSTGPVLFATC
jgi:flagellar basal body-associated protein FliL